MIPAEVIAKKRDGRVLSDAEIMSFIDGFTNGSIPDYQMSAMAMAIFFRGMDSTEITSLTRHMLATGESLDWQDGPPVVDKHSTGGIGDKVSLILAPMLACCGLRVPMISGRGLGITGGTLDKLESISGFRTDLSIDEIKREVDSIGCVITGTTPTIVPADRKLYALRDVTATVASIPLITSSIMSKKLAESLDALILDVKCGNGAFMRSVDDARSLAKLMVHVGQQMGVATSAIISDMNQPLGRMIGNSVEVIESIDALRGNGPDDLMELTTRLGCQLLVSTDLYDDYSAAQQKLIEAIDSGSAYERFEQMVQMQGGSLKTEPIVECQHTILSESAGYVSSIDGERLGRTLIEMGGGRQIQTDQINPAVGIEVLLKIGDTVEKDEPIANLYLNADSPRIVSEVRSSICISDDEPTKCPLVIEAILS